MSRFPDYNHCPYRFRCHRVEEILPESLPVSDTISSLNSDMPASESFIPNEAVEHTYHYEFSLKKYYLRSFFEVTFIDKINTPTLSAILLSHDTL